MYLFISNSLRYNIIQIFFKFRYLLIFIISAIELIRYYMQLACQINKLIRGDKEIHLI